MPGPCILRVNARHTEKKLEADEGERVFSYDEG